MAKKNTNILAIAGIAAAVLVVGFLVAGPFYQIQEGQQSVVTQFGEAVGTETTAGLKFKFPLIQESNPFHQKKPAAAPVASASAEAKKEMYKDTAEAATAILRKLMDRKKDDDD